MIEEPNFYLSKVSKKEDIMYVRLKPKIAALNISQILLVLRMNFLDPLGARKRSHKFLLMLTCLANNYVVLK